MLKKCFQPFLYSTIIVGFLLFGYLIMLPQSANLFMSILVITVSVACDYYEYRWFDRKVTVSMGSSNTVFTTILMGPLVAAIGTAITGIVLYIHRSRKYKTPRSPRSFAFNTAQFIIAIVIIDKLKSLLNFTFFGLSGLPQLLLLIIVYNLLNMIFISLIITFQAGKPCFEPFAIHKNLPYYIYTTILTTMLVYNYVDRGLFGLILVYSLFIPLQKMTQYYIQTRDQQEDLFIDALTGAYNFKYFQYFMEKKIASKEHFALIMLDLDKFKQINDNYGHLAGNKVLETIGKLVRRNVGNGGVFIRYGGDEFCIIVPNYEEALVVAEKLLQAKNDNRVIYDGQDIPYGMSIGLYKYEGKEREMTQIIEKADQAMYKAKAQGGNCIIDCNWNN